MNEERYYSKNLAGILPAHMPHWAIYRNTAAGPTLVALVIDEDMAGQIITALGDSDHGHRTKHEDATSIHGTTPETATSDAGGADTRHA